MSPTEVAGRIGPQAHGRSETAKAGGRPTRTLPTERVQFQKQLNVLRAYAAVSGQTGKPVTINEVGGVTKLNPSTVSLCNGFFADVGFLEKFPNGGYVPSADVISFLRAYQWSPETAAQKLGPTLRRTWFAQTLMAKLAMGPLEQKEAIRDLADAASAGPKYEAQLGTLIDFLEAAGIVRREGSLIREGARGAEIPDPTPAKEMNMSPSSVSDQRDSRPLMTTAFLQPTEGVVQFHVSVKVDMAEFSDWSPDRITSFFAGIAQVLAAKGALEKDVSR